MKYFYYLYEDEHSASIIRIKASKKPSERGTFKVQEFKDPSGWDFGPIKKVHYSVLKQFIYIGSTK